MVSTRAVTYTSAVDQWFAMYLFVLIVILIYLVLLFAFIVTIQLGRNTFIHILGRIY